MRLHDNTFFRRDPYFRYITAPRLDFLVQHPDFSYRVKTSLNFEQAGFRGGTRGGPVWGVALGDSFTFGMGVNQEATWIAHLAQITQSEIINLGVPGWGPQQYTRALERYGIGLNPKLIFYGLYRNDLQDAVLFDQWHSDPSVKSRLDAFLRQYSVAYKLTRLMLANLSPGTEDIALSDLAVTFNSKQITTTLKNDIDHFGSAWRLTERELDLAIRYSQGAVAKFVLLYFPSKEEVYWDMIKQKEKSLASFDDAITMFRTQLSDFCQKRQMFCLDLTPALRSKASQGEKLYYSHDSHWTEHGNKVIADQIYRFLSANKIQ
jgi:hypothetical protein